MRAVKTAGLFAVLFVGLVALTIDTPFAQTSRSGAKDGEWTSYHANTRGHHFSPLSQIDATNFSKLEVAWRFKTDSLGPRPEYKLEGTPLMVNGMIYATAGTRRAVVALKPDTGEVVWVHSEFEGKRAIN